MRKIFLICLLVLMAVPVLAVEPLVELGFGSITSKGSSPSNCYYGTFGVPVLTKTDAGFTLKTDVSYLHSDWFSDTTEVAVLRTHYLSAEKELYKVEDTRKVTTDSTETYTKWSFFVGLSSGTWTFVKTQTPENPDGEDVTYGCYAITLGATYKDMALKFSIEAVQQPGYDLYVPSVSLNIGL